MKISKMPGFTAETSLSKPEIPYRLVAGGKRYGAPAVIPQMSCWRTCYDISSTNHELVECARVCRQIKSIFNL